MYYRAPYLSIDHMQCPIPFQASGLTTYLMKLGPPSTTPSAEEIKTLVRSKSWASLFLFPLVLYFSSLFRAQHPPSPNPISQLRYGLQKRTR